MARKGKKKKNKKKQKRIRTNFNKKEFCEIFCQTCMICKEPDPKFCYTYVYKHEPKIFIHKIFNNLVDTHAMFQSEGWSILALSIEQFQNAVCRTGICFNGDGYASASCDSVESCYKEFKMQMGMVNPAILRNATNLIDFKHGKSRKFIVSYKKKQRKKAKKKRRVVFAAYPTFFSSSDAEFQATVRKILYGDSDNQQDKDQELSASDSGAASNSTKAEQS